jgi:secondary thiamine-phosphate synthase enzyme
VSESKIDTGLVRLWVTHTTATVALNEHDPALWEGILSTLTRLIPVNSDYRHNAKYKWTSRELNAHAHLLNCIMKANVMIPLHQAKMVLGTWRSILFLEFDGPRSRYPYVQIVGSD